ncbi:hypothetical protein V0U79_07950 [Hyphobacterium sp. HN65]|uniref:Peptidase S41 n=1 Tax=Hyphobacterium lacteum TaxID=3116575 RepID=A0ABU7LQV8_9PROT|nr:hypothetical protein [Hyphobacterium sp. HN65]MEE2526296.1 hypothetical protein [Hyphobacterium sp. HN65]
MRRFWRAITFPFRIIPWWGYLIILAVLGWLGRNILLIIATIIAFHPIPIPPLFQGEPETVAEARLQDIEHFQHVRRNERSLTADQRAGLQAAMDELARRAGTLSDAGFQLELARIQAMIDNGHSNASATRMVEPFARLPIRAAWMDGELRILRALPDAEDLLGARIVSINGVAARDALMAFRDAFGGNDAHFMIFAPLLVETPDYLEAVGMGAEVTTLGLVLPDGREETRALEAVAPAEDARRIYPGDLPLTWIRESDRWSVLAPSARPLYLTNPDNDYWFELLPGGETVYISIRSNLDDDSGESLRAWVARAEAEIRELAPRFVIVDQRFNGGGDLTQTEPLMSALGDIVGEDGRIYLLTSGNTFSAGIVNLAMARESAPGRTVIVGEEIGDRLQFWAEGFWYSLPNSGFRARYSTGFYDLQNGCHGIFICHWGSLHIFPVIVDDLDVDIAAPLTFEAYAAGHDPAMEAVLSDIGG